MTQNQTVQIDDEEFEAHPVFGSKKAAKTCKRQRRYRKIGMHRLKSTHLLTKQLIESV